MPLQPLLSRSLQYTPPDLRGGLRVLVLVADLPPVSRSGIGVSVAAECHALAQLGCSVRILTACREPLRVEGVAVDPLPLDAFPMELAEWDVLHLHSLGIAAVALEAAQRLGLPLVYTAHTLIEDELPGALDWITIQRCVLKTAQHVFFLNAAERERAIARDFSLRSRSSVRRHGIATETHEDTGQEREYLIVVPGRICRNKGTDIAVAALRHRMREESRISALFAGDRGNNDCETTVAALASEFPGRVRRLGWLDRSAIMRSLSRARIVLCPSRYEPFGLLPLEALQCGSPVIAAESDGAKDTLFDAPGVALLESHDPLLWTKAIQQELHQGKLLAASRTAGPAWVHERFHPIRQAHLLMNELALVRQPNALCVPYEIRGLCDVA